MRLFRYDAGGGARLGIETAMGRFDLTAVDPLRFGSLAAWLALPDPVAALWESASAALAPVPGDASSLAPLDAQEVWAAGVTYERSRVARMEESETGGDFYDKVYAAERPEIFLKATPRRVVGPGQPIRLRRDSTWDVPEPELTLALSAAGEMVGYTAGNDVSSRSIEGENPLYLPQAKIFDGCCALGPAIVIREPGAALPTVGIELTIHRDGEVVYTGETSSARIHRRLEDLAGYLFRELSFPAGAFLMTGTGIVPPDDFTLRAGDVVRIAVDGVGVLENPVAT